MLKGKRHTLKLVSRKGSTKKSNKLRKNYNCRIKTERCTRLSRIMVELKSPKGRTKRRTLTAKAIAAAATAKKKRKMLKKNKPRTRNKRVMVKPPSTLQKEAKL